jgi:hypothetical protein
MAAPMYYANTRFSNLCLREIELAKRLDSARTHVRTMLTVLAVCVDILLARAS